MGADDEQRGDMDRPRTNKPLHGPERPKLSPALLTVGILLAVLLVFAVIMWLRYNT